MNRRLFWSLLLALILPFAQVAAAAHELTHLKAPPTSIQCDHCELAAAVVGGAAPSAPLAIIPAALPHTTPSAPPVTAHIAEPFTAFASRAPPSLH
ncbi:MAG TPA: hypothetical protein VL593_09135 [Ramlibacter sp.]|nr:hypothetical protein [Ramlibacter sp.]